MNTFCKTQHPKRVFNFASLDKDKNAALSDNSLK